MVKTELIMENVEFIANRNFAQHLDLIDPLNHFRNEFYIPYDDQGKEHIYFCGNSLGLQPKVTESYILQELEDWRKWGVEGHFNARKPWMPYHEFLTESMSKIVGAQHNEVVVMNSLTANLHLMMVSFYKPTKKRFKILMEENAFPSDQYAILSQVQFHGFDPKEAIIEVKQKDNYSAIDENDILDIIEKEGDSIALILIGNVNYYTGQYFNIKKITEKGKEKGCKVGFDLAHGAGNLLLNLHQDAPDFAVWCSYKYLNSGPGNLSGCFIHESNASNTNLQRFAGWWGNDKSVRFQMRKDFNPIPTAEGWQLSNPPIFSLAAISASLSIFEKTSMKALNAKSRKMTGYLEHLVRDIKSDKINILTPNEKGCQLSIQLKGTSKALFDSITAEGVIADWREPDVIRVAPVPLYNTFTEVYDFYEILKNCLQQ